MAKSGFTLVEVLVTALIMTLIGGALLTVAIAGRRVSDLTNARLTAMTEAQRAVSQLTQDVRMASAGTVQCEGGGMLPREFEFQRVGVARNIRYFRDAGNQLIRRELDAGADRVMASGVTAFEFESSCGGVAPGGTVQFRLTAQTTSWRGPISQTMEAQVRIQNS